MSDENQKIDGGSGKKDKKGTSKSKPVSEEEIKKLKCHFTWVQHDLEDNLPRLDILEERTEKWIHTIEFSKYIATTTSFTLSMASVLCATFKKNYPEAKTKLKVAKGQIKEWSNSDEPAENILVFNYMYKACEIHLNYLSISGNHHEKTIRKDLDKIQPLMIQIGQDKKCRAVVHALRAIWFDIEGNLEGRLGYFKLAVEENPESWVWHQFLYTSIRRERREKDFLSKPSEDEIALSKRILDLAPNHAVNHYTYSICHRDSLISSRFRNGGLNSIQREMSQLEISRICIESLKKAIQLDPTSTVYKIRLAEYYSSSFLHEKCKDMVLARKLFEQCIENPYGHESHGFHKAGKFYALSTINDIKKATQMFEQSLEFDPRNYPCIMDLITLQLRTKKPASETIETIDRYIDKIDRKISKSRLLVIKSGLYTTLSMYAEATEACITAIEIDLENAFHDFLTREQFSNMVQNSEIQGIQLYIQGEMKRVTGSISRNPDRHDKLKQVLSFYSSMNNAVAISRSRYYDTNNNNNFKNKNFHTSYTKSECDFEESWRNTEKRSNNIDIVQPKPKYYSSSSSSGSCSTSWRNECRGSVPRSLEDSFGSMYIRR